MGLSIVDTYKKSIEDFYLFAKSQGATLEYMQFEENITLAKYSNYKIGGPARFFAEIKTKEDLLDALAQVKAKGLRLFILGGGNNLLISDKGFDGAVLKIAIGGVEVDAAGKATVGAGTLVSDFLRFAELSGLSGWQWAGGLPGTIGGAVWGNAGAFGGETKDSVISVTSVRIDTGEVVERTRAQCAFDYRSSIFKEQEKSGIKEVIVSVTLALRPGNREAISREIEDHILYRKTRQPLEYPNIGSIFKNIPIEKVPRKTLEIFREVIKNDPFPVLPVAALSSASGLKEYRVGDAMVSPKHPNFIVNVGAATAEQVRQVMNHVREVNKEKHGVDLEQEVIFVE